MKTFTKRTEVERGRIEIEENQSGIIWVDLNEYGYIKAGESKGNPDSYVACLDRMQRGYLVSSDNTRGKSAEEKERLQEEIDKIRKENIDLEGEIREIKVHKIKDKEKDIDDLQSEIGDIRDRGVDYIGGKNFRWTNFLVGLVFLIFLTSYLLFFYISIAERAFYGLDPSKIIGAGGIAIGILPDFGILLNTLSRNFVLIVIPSVFFCFGYALHYLIEDVEGKIRYVWITLLILVTFVLDSFMAYKIHEETIKAMRLVYDPDELAEFIKPWNEDINFYIVLMMGFVVFIIWSIIFHQVMNEWAKRDKINRKNREIKNRNAKINNLKKEMNEAKSKLEKIQTQIASNKDRMENLTRERDREIISLDDLLKNFAEFKEGWIRYLNGLEHGKAQSGTIGKLTEEYINTQILTNKITVDHEGRH